MMKKINDWLAIKLTLGMSTMWCVYAFFALAVLPTFIPGIEQVCMYISSTVIQLVALPCILVGQSLLNKKSERRAAQDHATLMKNLAMLQQLVADSHKVLREEKVERAKVEELAAHVRQLECFAKSCDPVPQKEPQKIAKKRAKQP